MISAADSTSVHAMYCTERKGGCVPPNGSDSFCSWRSAVECGMVAAGDAARARRPYCVGLSQSEEPTAGSHSTRRRRQRRQPMRAMLEKVLRKVRRGEMPPAGIPRPAAPVTAASRNAGSSPWTGLRGGDPNPGRPGGPPAEPRGIQQRDPRSAGTGHQTRVRRCRWTIRATVSTNTATCFRSRRPCWRSTCRRRAR